MFNDEAFDWDDNNIEHIALHGVEPWEAEDALLDPYVIGADAYNVRGEVRWGAIGATDAGRILAVVYTRRGGKVRPIMAKDAEDTEKRRYRRR